MVVGSWTGNFEVKDDASLQKPLGSTIAAIMEHASSILATKLIFTLIKPKYLPVKGLQSYTSLSICIGLPIIVVIWQVIL
jgi:hypothetical protein